MLGLAALLAAQGTPFVSPVYYTDFEGNAATTWPFSSDNSGGFSDGIRMQQIHGDLSGRPMTIRSLALRANQSGSTLSGAATTLDLELRIGEAALAAVGGTFDANYLNGPTVAMSRRPFNIPARPASTASFVGPWDVVFPFDQAFAFSGQSDLAWEVINRSQTATRRNGSFNDYAVPNNGWVGTVAAGARILGRTPCTPYDFQPSCALSGQNGGEMLFTVGATGPVGGFSGIGIGFSNPAIPYPWGACNQTIFTDAAIIQSGNFGASGTFSQQWILPWDPAWARGRVMLQAVSFVPGQAQAVLTQGYEFELPPGLPPTPSAQIVFGNGQAPPVGVLMNPNQQLVVRFDS
jgi:hypothetical protein